MIRVRTIQDEKAQYAAYEVGQHESLNISFAFRFPAELPPHLTPILSAVTLYDIEYNVMQRIDQGNIDIQTSEISVSKPSETKYYLLYQTNFLVHDESTREELEQFLKNCQTIYTIDGGLDGTKNYVLFDKVSLSADKTEAYMFKQINLNK